MRITERTARTAHRSGQYREHLLCVGSGYLSHGELYELGAITTGVNLLCFLVVGTPWLFSAAG